MDDCYIDATLIKLSNAITTEIAKIEANLTSNVYDAALVSYYVAKKTALENKKALIVGVVYGSAVVA